MIIETQILSAVIEYLNEQCDLFTPVLTGGLSVRTGINAEIVPGYAKSDYLNGNVFQRLPILVLIKHEKHRTAMETAFTLSDTVRNITRGKVKIHKSVSGISMGSAPEFVQKNGTDYIYSFIFNIDYLQ